MSVTELNSSTLQQRNYPLQQNGPKQSQGVLSRSNMFDDIPVEIKNEIFQNFELSSLKLIMLVSKDLQRLGKLALQGTRYSFVSCMEPEMFYDGIENRVRRLSLTPYHCSRLPNLLGKFTLIEHLYFTEGMLPIGAFGPQASTSSVSFELKCVHAGEPSQKLESSLNHLIGLVRLRSLRLGRCYPFKDIDLLSLNGLTNLSSLSLANSRAITLNGIAQAFPFLQSIQMSNCREIGLNTPLTNLKNLNTLKLHACHLKQEDIKLLESITNLRELAINDSALENRSLEYVSGLTNLRSLSLRWWKITPHGLTNLSGLNQLVELSLRGCKVTDEGIQYLTGLTKISNLHLGCSNITDKGLECLMSFHQLQKLNLNLCNRITNKGVELLTVLKELQSLSLCYCAGVDREVAKHFTHLRTLTMKG